MALSSILQQLFNAADTAIIGLLGSSGDLAAVGTNGEIVALFVTISSGLSMGANVLIARHIGEGAPEKIRKRFPCALTLSLALGILALLTGESVTSLLLRQIHTPAAIFDQAALYLRIYLLGLPFLMLYDFAAGILRAKGDSKSPFTALTVSGIANVILNLFFVAVCHLGVAGVALATVLSTALSAFLLLLHFHKETGVLHLSLGSFTPAHLDLSSIKAILAVGVPSAIQGTVFCLANLFVQSGVNRFGTAAAAGNGKRCRSILRCCLILSILCCSLITLPLSVFPHFFAGFFTTSPAVADAACLRIRYILLFEPICCLYEIPGGTLRGTGHAALPAVFTVLGTCLLRIGWILTVFSAHPSLPLLFVIFPVSWVVTILLMNVGLTICHKDW